MVTSALCTMWNDCFADMHQAEQEGITCSLAYARSEEFANCTRHNDDGSSKWGESYPCRLHEYSTIAREAIMYDKNGQFYEGDFTSVFMCNQTGAWKVGLCPRLTLIGRR